jgi:glycosyltransferase involved in cell wall biosynthesis
LPVDLDIVEGVPHEEARARFARADIVVDQLNAGWYGLLAIECLALGKPVLAFLHDEARARTEQAYGLEVPLVDVSAETLRDRLAQLVDAGPAEWHRVGEASRAYVEQVHDVERVTDMLVELYEGLRR